MLQKIVIRRVLVYRSMTAKDSHSQSDAGKTPVSRILFVETNKHVLHGTVPHGILAQTPGEILLTRTDHDCRSHASLPSPYLTIWPIQTAPYLAISSLAATDITCNCIYDDRPRNRATLRIDKPVSMTFPHVAATILTIPLSSLAKRTCPWCNQEGLCFLLFLHIGLDG
jgi:hypothetical protein